MPTQDIASHDSKSPIIVFDVNETLLDFNVLTPVSTRIFGDPKMVRVWFDNVILYMEALTLAARVAARLVEARDRERSGRGSR